MQYTSSNFQTGKIAHCHGSSVCTKVLNSVVVACTSPLSAAIYVRKLGQFCRWTAVESRTKILRIPAANIVLKYEIFLVTFLC